MNLHPPHLRHDSWPQLKPAGRAQRSHFRDELRLVTPEEGLHHLPFSTGCGEPCPRCCLPAALSSVCCTASLLLPSVRPSRQLLLVCPTSRQGKSRLAGPIPAKLPSLLKPAQGCQWCEPPGGFGLTQLVLSAGKLLCPSPSAPAGSFLSCVMNRELLVSCLSPHAVLSAGCRPRQRLRAVPCYLTGRLRGTRTKARTHSSELCLIPLSG